MAGTAPFRWAAPTKVVGALSACLDPPRALGPAPHWLFPHQVEPWRRTLAAVNAHGGAILAEAVGRGKTWIALAVATEFDGPAMVLAPAILESQWRVAAGAAGIDIGFHSHERLSRGALPADAAFVIIDELHRFRTPTTRRANAVAPWLAGRRVMGCTATPIVNRDIDLLAVLDLIFPDDVLALHGVRSIAALAGATTPPRSLDRIVIRTVRTELEWRRDEGVIEPSGLEETRAARGVTAIDRLELSRQAPIARLIRVTLLDALASSDAALLAALRRYGALLAHARDAGGAPRHLLRRYAGAELDQTALWSLLGDGSVDVDLAPDDAATVHDILRTLHPADTAWLPAIRALQIDGVPTICFTRHRATALALRNALDGPVAWISGNAAGIGATRLTRPQVLDAFGPGRASWSVLRRTPSILVATDVVAEGLDLQGASRVVHLDVPWTAMRIAQREGRLTRPGQHSASVTVVTRLPAAVIEQRLALHRRVRRKDTCARRWLDALQRATGNGRTLPAGPASACVVRTRGVDASLVAIAAERGAAAGTWVMCGRDGSWDVDCTVLESLLARAHAAPVGYVHGSECDILMLDALSAATRLLTDSSPRSPRLVHRVHVEAARARRDRNVGRLAALDRLLRFIGNRQNRGGRELIHHLESLHRLSDADIVVPDQRPLEPSSLRIVAAVVFRSDDRSLR